MGLVYYRFRSQPLTSLATVRFSGTGISVWQLKREILLANRLLSPDVDIRLYAEDGTELEDDNTVIPRSATVLVRRSQSQRGKGKGNVSRYLSGKPKLVVSATTNTNYLQTTNAVAAPPVNEDDAIAQMFSAQDSQWQATQSQLATAARIDNPRTTAKLDESIPEYYICYKCGEKGKHHIRNCPKNNDPNWEGVRIKKTTGIPKSYLRQLNVEPQPSDDIVGKHFMVNQDGKYVVQVADTRAWQTFQEKAQSHRGDGNNTEGGIDYEMPITDNNYIELKDTHDSKGRPWKEPVLMPCCEDRWSKEQIEEKLIDDDFKCPNCGQMDIYLDSLKPDVEMSEKIKSYLKEVKANADKGNDQNGEAVAIAGNITSEANNTISTSNDSANNDTIKMNDNLNNEEKDHGVNEQSIEEQPTPKRQQLHPPGNPMMMPMGMLPFMPFMMPMPPNGVITNSNKNNNNNNNTSSGSSGAN
ncbi:cleavage polyadenylation factor subunit [Martiniozyma asiatica (nom. inval.)]|nr:cleavage polyadenylation factor subunit [Martiniozyma asiatica]